MNFNSTNSTQFGKHPTAAEWKARIFPVCLVGTINFCGFASSCFTIVLIFTSKLKLNNINLMLANLVSASMLHTFMFVLPQNIFVLYLEHLPNGACGWLGFTFFLVQVQMIIFPPFLAVNRYIALYQGTVYEKVYTIKNIILMISGSWFISALIPLPFQMGGKTGFDYDNGHCCIIVRDSFWWTVYYCFVILVPLIGFCNGTVLYCNWKIYKKLMDHAVTSSLSQNVVSQNRELLYFMMVDAIIPLICHTVYHVTKVTYMYRENETWKVILPALNFTAATFRCLTILILLRPYRQAVKKMCGCAQGNTIAPMQMEVNAH